MKKKVNKKNRNNNIKQKPVRSDKDIDIVLLKKKKKRRRQLVKFFMFAVVISVSLFMYAKVDDWYPKLEGMGEHFRSIKSDGDESFPLSISGGSEYQAVEMDGYLAILSDAYFYVYDQNGELYDERQHAYANAMIQSTGSNALIYESGGYRLRVDNKNKNLYEKKLENTILFARISSNGNVAVITTSDTYMCRLVVFNEKGSEIYARNCVERISDLSFSEDGNGCILATTDALNGELISKFISISFNSKTDNWVSEQIDTICLKTFYDSSGVFVIGENKCAYYNNDGKIEMTYDYPTTLVDWDYGSSGAVLLFENETKRKSYITTISSESKTSNEKCFDDSENKCIELAGDKILVMNKSGINSYDLSCENEENIFSENSYEKFIIIDNDIFLLGYDKIDKINY